jgi:hypothetical protein
MATLTDKLIGETYCSLIKTSDNNGLSGPIDLTDGDGIASSLKIGTKASSEGIVVTGPISNTGGDISSGANVSGDVITGTTCITTTGPLLAATTAGNKVGIGTSTPNEKLTVSGNLSADGNLYVDIGGLNTSNGFGTAGQRLVTTGTQICWENTPAGAGKEGDICGSGTGGYVTRFVGSGTVKDIGNSIIQDNGSRVGIGVAPSSTHCVKVNGTVCSTGFIGGVTGNLTGNICGSPTVQTNLTVNGNTCLVATANVGNITSATGLATLNDIIVGGSFQDKSGSQGSSGSVLQSTGSQVQWVNLTSLPSADAASKLSPGAAIGITGGVTGAATTFTGENDININATAINGSCINSGTVNANYIADSVKLAAGKSLSNNTDQRDRVAYIDSSGVMEIGKYIDFHDADSSGDYDVRLTSNGNILTLDGNFKATEDIVAFASSDKRLKDNLTCVTDSNNIINGLNNYCFDWNDKSEREGPGIGVLAQDVQKVLPNAVCERDNGYLAVDYNQFIPVLLQRVKELSAEVEDLKAKIS